jgi:hypothetical protein
MLIPYSLFYDTFLCHLTVGHLQKKEQKKLKINQDEQQSPKAYGLDFTAITLDPDGIVNASASRD